MQTPITYAILGITILISYMAFENRGLFEQLKHAPYIEKRNKAYLRMLTAGFVHGSWTHLLINMYVLYSFGTTIEMRFNAEFGLLGKLYYVLFYLSTIIAANISTYVKHQNNPGFASIGASGAISGIVFAFVLFYPLHKIGFIFLPGVDFPAIILGVGYLIYSAWASKNRQDHIDHDAHYYGAIYGVLFCVVFSPSSLLNFIEQIKAVF